MTQTSHTQQEIEKFDQLAYDFWNPEGEFKTLHQINPIRLNFIKQFIDLNDKKVVDVGCGGGILSEALAQEGATVSAIDLSEQGIEAGKSQQQQSNSSVDYQVISSHDFLANKTQDYAAVFCMEMLEHVEDPAQIITDCSNLVSEGGLVVFSTINRTKKAHLLAVVVAEYIMRMVPKGTHDAKLFIKPSEMVKMAKLANLEPIDIIGFEYRPLQRDFVRSDNVDINYIFAFKKMSTNNG